MDDLVQFLRARYDEDEAAALSWPEGQRDWETSGGRQLSYASGVGEQVSAISVSGPLGWERIYVKRDVDGIAEHIARQSPARVLADVGAKRAIIRQWEYWEAAGSKSGPWAKACRLLALPYADHPDYREEWRP